MNEQRELFGAGAAGARTRQRFPSDPMMAVQPKVGKRDTSREAAASVEKSMSDQARKVLVAFLNSAGNGLTDEEGERLLGIRGNSYRPNRIRLVEMGFVVKSEDSRRTDSGRRAIVWKISDNLRSHL